MEPLIPRFMRMSDSVLFVVGSYNETCHDETIESIISTLRHMGETSIIAIRIVFNKQDLLPIEWFQETIQALRDNFESMLNFVTSFNLGFIDRPGCSALEACEIDCLLHGIVTVLQESSNYGSTFITRQSFVNEQLYRTPQNPERARLSWTESCFLLDECIEVASISHDEVRDAYYDLNPRIWCHFKYLRSGFTTLVGSLKNKKDAWVAAELFRDQLNEMLHSWTENHRRYI